MEIIFLIGRILYGGFFVISGINHFSKVDGMTGYAASKGLPYPKAAVILSGIWVILGGLGIILGIYVQLSIISLAVFLVIVTLTMHKFWSATDPAIRMNEMISFMKNTALLGADLMFLMIKEPWVLSLIL